MKIIKITINNKVIDRLNLYNVRNIERKYINKKKKKSKIINFFSSNLN